jgi:hypothetical protein
MCYAFQEAPCCGSAEFSRSKPVDHLIIAILLDLQLHWAEFIAKPASIQAAIRNCISSS